MDTLYPENGKCCFCGEAYINGGYSPAPIVHECATLLRCCEKCYLEDVIPTIMYRNTDEYATEVHKRERKVRRKLATQGFRLKKSRTRNYTADDYGGYQIIEIYSNRIEAGEKFDLSLEDVEDFTNEE